jgi:hypothetical protein
MAERTIDINGATVWMAEQGDGVQNDRQRKGVA